MAKRRETSCTGASMALRTTKSNTNAALGTEAEDTDAAVEVKLKKYKLLAPKRLIEKEKIY